MVEPGTIVLLNGTPRAGKSSIVEVFQSLPGPPWMNLGPGRYDVEVDTATASPSQCAAIIYERVLSGPPTALATHAG